MMRAGLQVKSACLAFLLVAGSTAVAQTCVTGILPSNPSAVYYVGSGTVTDRRVGLMWDQCPWGKSGAECGVGSAGTHTWQQALLVPDTANGVTHKGYTDWRLPNFKELVSLVEQCRTLPSINDTVFPGMTSGGYFWSSSPNSGNAAASWGVDFGMGFPYITNRDVTYGNVRLVRTVLY